MPPAQWINVMGATAVGKLSDFTVLSDGAAAAIAPDDGDGSDDDDDSDNEDDVVSDDDSAAESDDRYSDLIVRAVYVGQGDCNAILGCEDDESPLLYFDCGGGCGKAAATYPWHPDNVAPAGRAAADNAFDLTHTPYIFLSHWDHDHFYSAENVAALHGCTFIAPRQKVSGRYVQFVEENLTVEFWPRDATPWEFPINNFFSLIVERCTGDEAGNRNYSGLALTLVMLRDDDGEDDDDVESDDDDDLIDDEDDGIPDDWHINTSQHVQYILLPGDGPYQYIPTLNCPAMRNSGRYVGLFAYHHGSKTKWTAETTNCLPRPFRPDGGDDGVDGAAPALLDDDGASDDDDSSDDDGDMDGVAVGADAAVAGGGGGAVDADTTVQRCVYTYGLKTSNASPFHVPAATAIAQLRARGWTGRGNTSGDTAADAVLGPGYVMPGNPFASRGDRDLTFFYPPEEEDDADDDEPVAE